MQLSNQPITWKCGPGQNNLLNSKLNVRMEKKGDLSNFERGMVATDLLLKTSERKHKFQAG